MLVDETSEAMLISHFGKIIRIDTKQIREAGRSTQGFRLLNLESGDKVASAAVLHEKEDENGSLLQEASRVLRFTASQTTYDAAASTERETSMRPNGRLTVTEIAPASFVNLN